MPLYAASCEQGASPSLSQGCRNITQVNCLSVYIVTIYMCENANSAVLFSLILSSSPHFWNCIIELHSATDSFPYRVPCLRFSIISSVVFTHDVISVPFTQLPFHIGSEHILGMHTRAELRRLQASPRTTWLVHLT